MRKPTGQMQELTQEKLDDYNTLYCWEYNDMCNFIENHSEEEFIDHYETYNRLCEDFGQNLVDEFIEDFDDSITLEEQVQITHDNLGVWEADDEDDLVDEITTASGWCIKSIDYDIQLK